MTLSPASAATTVAIDEILDEALLRTLEPAIATFDRLFASARPVGHVDGEPDGFDGLDRRGPLDRLLSSEWLLAAEVPDEFIRRLEDRELAYLRPHTVQPQRPPASLVLFDAGPDQLGQPRIAQLAVLVVLGRRARAAGAELRWGTLGDPGRFEASGQHALRRFVEARTWERPAELPLDAFVDDALVVSRRPGPPFAAQQLELSDDGDEVVATLIDHRTRIRRQARIPMPPQPDAVRLHRNPGGRQSGPIRQAQERVPISNLVFDQAGNKLLARVEAHRVAVYPVPNSPSDKPGRTRYASAPTSEGVIAAAGRVKKSILLVHIVDDGAAIVVRNVGGNVTGPTGRFRLENRRIPTPGVDDVLGRVTWTDGTLRVHVGGLRLTYTGSAYRVDQAEIAFRWGRAGFDLSATPTEEGWLVRAGSVEWRHQGGQVRGVFPRSVPTLGEPHRSEARLVITDDDGRSLVGMGPTGEREVLYNAGEPIVDAVFHERVPTYAVRTASGRVVVRSWLYTETLLEILPR